MSEDIYQNLKQLGGATVMPSSPEDAELERVENPQADVAYNVRFTAPEFTSLCPMTGQPDFAHLVIDYVPGKWLVESKSLKLFLGSFRNHGAFHEDCTVSIARRLADFLEPQWLRIGGYWYPRGGIPIDVFWQTGPLPDGVWIPDQACRPIVGGVKICIRQIVPTRQRHTGTDHTGRCCARCDLPRPWFRSWSPVSSGIITRPACSQQTKPLAQVQESCLECPRAAHPCAGQGIG